MQRGSVPSWGIRVPHAVWHGHPPFQKSKAKQTKKPHLSQTSYDALFLGHQPFPLPTRLQVCVSSTQHGWRKPRRSSRRAPLDNFLKAGLKLNIQKTKIMASSTITSWQIDGETMETVTDFIFLDPKITADGDCSHEIKRRLLLGRKAMTNLDSILKSRDITLPTKVH